MSVAMKRVELAFEVPWTHPSWVLEDDEVMPESAMQDEAAQTIVSTWRCRARAEGRAVRVRRNLAVRWDEEHPAVGVDPDVCLLDPPPDAPDAELTSLCLWKPGTHPPRVALEIVSARTAEKDYGDGLRKYAASGTHELWVFDPLSLGPSGDGGPWVLQVWTRSRNALFRRVYAGEGPARSDALGAWLVVTRDGLSLRVSDDEDGTRLWPTEEEEAERNRAAMEAERAAKETERAAKDAERAAKEAALARVAELEALLAASRGTSNT